MHIIIAIGSCIITEAVMKALRGTRIRIWDGSAAVTGMLIAFNLPFKAPYYVTIIASFVAISIVKEFFGGLGTNFINPALAGRAFAMFASITIMSDKNSYLVANPDAASTGVDAVTSATPMAIIKYFTKGSAKAEQLPRLWDLFIGNTGGSMGEISALMLLIGGAILLFKRYIKWQVPAVYISTVFIFAFTYAISGGIGKIDPAFSNVQNAFIYGMYHVLGGGLILGAFFMATDMVTTPVTTLGNIIFALGCGILTSLIRIFGQYPEGVMFSILIMNIVTPLISKFIRPRIYGTLKDKDKRRQSA
jgi:electron transport complex protein RnfD